MLLASFLSTFLALASPFETGEPSPAEAAGVVLYGSFKQPNHLPLAGVRLDRIDEDGEAFLLGQSGSDGTFEIEIAEPVDSQLVVRASFYGRIRPTWTLRDIESGSRLNLGRTTMHLGATVEVSVLDRAGNPLDEEVTVRAYAPAYCTSGKGGNLHRPVVRAEGLVDRRSGKALLTGLPPRRIALVASSPLLGTIEGPDMRVSEGESPTATIQYAGGPLDGRIMVQTWIAPNVRLRDPSKVILTAADGSERESLLFWQGRDGFVFENVEPGKYIVSVRDPNWRPWQKAGVRPGQRVEPELVGSSSLLLEVYDSSTRKPVHEFVCFFPGSQRMREQLLSEVEETRLAKATRYGGLRPQKLRLRLSKLGYVTQVFHDFELLPQQERYLRVEMVRAGSLRAEVHSFAGEPCGSGLQVTIRPLFKVNVESRPSCYRTELTGEGGVVEFDGLAPGPYSIVAKGETGWAEPQFVTVVADSTAHTVSRLPAWTRFMGRVILPDGIDFSDWKLILRSGTQETTAHVAPYREFDVRDLPAGVHELGLRRRGEPDGPWIALQAIELRDKQTLELELDLREVLEGR